MSKADDILAGLGMPTVAKVVTLPPPIRGAEEVPHQVTMTDAEMQKMIAAAVNAGKEAGRAEAAKATPTSAASADDKMSFTKNELIDIIAAALARQAKMKPEQFKALPVGVAPKQTVAFDLHTKGIAPCPACGHLTGIVRHEDTLLCHGCGEMFEEGGQRTGRRIDIEHEVGPAQPAEGDEAVSLPAN
jgi:hypothetical protein